MASSFAWSESYSTGPTRVDTSFLNLLNTNTASGADTTTNPAAAPIPIPAAGTNYSYERYLQGHWTGSFSTISSLYFWKSGGTPGTGLTLNAGAKGNQTFATPVNTSSAIATGGIPTTQGTGLTPAYSAAYSDYLVLQLAVGTTAAPGAMATITYSIQWNET